MSEKRFKVVQDPRVQTEYFIYDNENKISRNITDYPFINQDVCSKIVMLFNEQQDTILTLKRRLERITRGYEHLPHKNGLTPNEWVIESQEKELKKKNEQISEWIEQQSKDIAKISEQQEEISYWKHRVSSLLFILSQFDNEKVKKLLEELDE